MKGGLQVEEEKKIDKFFLVIYKLITMYTQFIQVITFVCQPYFKTDKCDKRQKSLESLGCSSEL